MERARAAGEPGLIGRLIEAAGGRAGTHAVFGTPIGRSSVTVVPAPAPGVAPVAGTAPRRRGDGLGGGGTAVADPAFIEVSDDGGVFR